MLSASNMPLPHIENGSGEVEDTTTTTLLLLPSFTLVTPVTKAGIPTFINSIINQSSCNNTPVFAPSAATPTPPSGNIEHLPFNTKPYPHDYLILLCSHSTRDARCGQSAPLLRREFERHLRPLGLQR